MKASLLLLASAFLSLPLHAAVNAPKACGNFIQCGTFTGTAKETYTDGTTKKLTERLELREIDADTVDLQVTDTNPKTKKSRTWVYRMKFSADGLFKMFETAPGHEGELAADGGCQQMRCNYRFQPSVVMTTGNFTFNGDFVFLTVHQLFEDGPYFIRGSKLTKK